MRKYLILFFFTITLLFLVGCEKKEEGKAGTITPIVTVTAEPSPTDIPASIDSGDEKFVDLTDKQVDEIIKLSEKYEMNGWDYTIISRELMAYYLYTENVDIQLPVIINSTPEKSKELFG